MTDPLTPEELDKLIDADWHALDTLESARTMSVLRAMLDAMAAVSPPGTRVGGMSVDADGRFYGDLEISGLPVRQRFTLAPGWTSLTITSMVGTRELPTPPRRIPLGEPWRRALRLGTVPE